MTQIVAGTGPYTLTKTWAVNGTPTDVGAVTIGVVDGNGDEVVAAATATTNNADGTYTYSLADQANPDQLKVTWTRSDTSADLVDRIEVTGGLLFSEIQARTFKAKADADSTVIPLTSSTSYTDAMIADARTAVTDDLERWTGRGWIPRYARVEFKGNGSYVLDVEDGICRLSDGYRLNRPGRFNDIAVILSATDGGSDVKSSVVVDEGQFRRTDSPWTQSDVTDPFNITIEYVYGLPGIVNSADRMGLLLTVDRLVPSGVTDRALTVDSDYGTVRLVQPGGPQNNVSRLPEVNAWVVENSARAPFG